MTSNHPLSFQRRVSDWMMETFSMEVTRDTTERNHRFLEEALELVQSLNCTREEAHMLVDYVFGRPIGAPEQEVGGVTVTLAALCNAADIGVIECGERELARCWQNIDRIRAKQAGKPRHSPLPGPLPDETKVPLPRIRLKDDIYDDGADHHPPGIIAHKGDVLEVRELLSVGAAHPGASPGKAFIVRPGEFEEIRPEEPT